jgi:hypothetical protein
MKKRIGWLTAVVLTGFVIAWWFRFELLFYFQCSRLRSMDCHTAGTVSCIDKMWAHRVNTLERFRLVKNKFSGIEADIVFDSVAATFWVYHPPAKSQLLLETYLQEVMLTGKNNCWLDTRFVNNTNVAQAAVLLQAMDNKYQIKDKTIFELYDITAANYLAAMGFRVSLHIPLHILADTAALRFATAHLSAAVGFVSQESAFVKQLEQYFPGKKVATWSISFKNYIIRKPLAVLAADPQVAVILVNVKSRQYK